MFDCTTLCHKYQKSHRIKGSESFMETVIKIHDNLIDHVNLNFMSVCSK